MLKNKNEIVDTVVSVAKECAKDFLVYATVGAAVVKAAREFSKAKDYFDKK